MNVNLKQKQLIDELFTRAKDKFPEIIFKNLDNSPDDPEHIWVNVIADMDEEREIKLVHYTSKIQNEILTKYGYAISIMPENPNLILA